MKRSSSTIIWVNYLSCFTLPAIFWIACQNKCVNVRFLSISYFANIIVLCVKPLSVFSIETEKIVYSLGDMKVGSQSMGLKFQHDLPKTSYSILQKLKKSATYKEIVKLLPEEQIDIYFERQISEEIYSIVRLFMIVHWYDECSKRKDNNILLCPYSPLIQELKTLWGSNSIHIRLHRNFDYLRSTIKNLLKNKIKKYLFFRNIIVSKNHLNDYGSSVAVHYAEGINTNTRSDIFWYTQNVVDPERILFYFDLNKSSRNPVSREICDMIEKMNMRWICLKRKALSNPDGNKFKNGRRHMIGSKHGEILKINARSKMHIDRWVMMKMRNLLLDIELWRKFYRLLNIKIVFDIGAQTTEALAQSMALDFNDGIRVGMQRSTISLSRYMPFLRYNANHLFFIWSKEANKHKGNSGIIREFIVSGFPFGKVFHGKASDCDVENIKNKKFVKLVIALFDNVYSDDLCYSENMMNTFYHAFLEWLIKDQEIAIVIKEKKPEYLNRLTGVSELLLRAEQTGRFVRTRNALSRFPSDVSYGADVAVGIGISSAVVEAVITGCKGIHCDLPGHKSHPFYKWGYERIIFDDIDRLIMALRRYKESPERENKLGDWSSYIDRLDPFRDEGGSERMGSYMKWLLEGYGQGRRRDEALKYANNLYARQWGEDNVIEMAKQ